MIKKFSCFFIASSQIEIIIKNQNDVNIRAILLYC